MALYQARQVDHVRHTNEWVGLMVVLAALLFVGAVLEAGVLRDWFRPVSRLRILLPQSGVGGLAVGADIDVLGIRAGTVTRVVLATRIKSMRKPTSTNRPRLLFAAIARP